MNKYNLSNLYTFLISFPLFTSEHFDISITIIDSNPSSRSILTRSRMAMREMTEKVKVEIDKRSQSHLCLLPYILEWDFWWPISFFPWMSECICHLRLAPHLLFPFISPACSGLDWELGELIERMVVWPLIGQWGRGRLQVSAEVCSHARPAPSGGGSPQISCQGAMFENYCKRDQHMEFQSSRLMVL